VHAVGNEGIRELTEFLPVRLIPIDQARALSIKHPAVSTGSIARGSYRGHPPLPQQDEPTAEVERFLVARAGLDASVVHDFTRVLFEERSQLIAQNALAGFIANPNSEGKLALPIHEGARRYYDREKPNFWQKNTRILAPTLYVIVISSSAFFAIRSRIQARRRVRMSHFNLDLMNIADAAEKSDQREELLPLHDRLVNMLRVVVVDLDQERVNQNEFEHFSFTWNAVDTLVRDRLSAAGKTAAGPRMAHGVRDE
jgi:hypothetical protein